MISRTPAERPTVHKTNTSQKAKQPWKQTGNRKHSKTQIGYHSNTDKCHRRPIPNASQTSPVYRTILTTRPSNPCRLGRFYTKKTRRTRRRFDQFHRHWITSGLLINTDKPDYRSGGLNTNRNFNCHLVVLSTPDTDSSNRMVSYLDRDSFVQNGKF